MRFLFKYSRHFKRSRDYLAFKDFCISVERRHSAELVHDLMFLRQELYTHMFNLHKSLLGY